MSSTWEIEPSDELIRDAIDRLRDYMPDAIAAVNAAYGDAYELVVPDDDAYDDGTGDRFAKSPYIEVTIGEDDTVGDDATGLWTLGQDAATALFPLTVLVWLDEPITGPALHVKLKRYTNCVKHVLRHPDAFPSYRPALRRIRRSWRLNEQAKDEFSSFGYVRFEFAMDVLI